jgi:hypothetical protein
LAGGDRSVEQRFGGGYYIKLADGTELHFGFAITGEGPGQGVALYPWVLDKYERVLRLRPPVSWLLKRLLKHGWERDAIVFVSLRRICLEADVERSTLQTYMKYLVQRGYIDLLEEDGGPDRRNRYEVSGIYAALAICVALDPTSKWATDHGSISIREAKRLGHKYKESGRRVKFDFDFSALERLVERHSQTLKE